MSHSTRGFLLALAGILFSLHRAGAYDLQTTPDVHAGYFGSGLCLERINTDYYLDILASMGYPYTYGGDCYLINATPDGWPCCFYTPSANLGFAAQQVISGHIRGANSPRDFVMASYSPVNEIRIYTNNLDANLTNPQHIYNCTSCRVALGRVSSNDIYDDMVTSPGDNGQTIYYFNNNNGSIPSSPSSTISTNFYVGQIKLANLTSSFSDNYSELIVASGTTLKIFPNNDGVLGTTPFTINVYSSTDVWDFCIGDVNRDGFKDIVAINDDSPPGGGIIKVCLNHGGTFYSTPDITINYGYGGSQVALGEINYDGKLDLAIADGGTISILPGNGNGTFQTGSSVVWSSVFLPPWLGLEGRFGELTFADIRGRGAQSLIGSAMGDAGGDLMVFKNLSNPPPGPVPKYSVQSSVDRHPLITWIPNDDADMSEYHVYRALMSDTTQPTHEDFDLLAVVNSPDTSYLDTTVYIHTQFDNYKVWYAVTAVDDSSNESLMGDPVSFWGYHEDSNGSGAIEGLVTQPENFNVNALPNPFNPTTAISYQPTTSLV